GWGMLNVKAAADLLQEYKNSPGTRRVVEDRLTTTTTSRSYAFTWDGVSSIRATLCWIDPAGAATTSTDLRNANLVNNLNLTVTVTGPTGTVYQPWTMPFVGNWTNAMLSSAATTGVNNTDNVEQVFIASPGTAGLYSVTVNYSGTLTNSLQHYSLILSGGVSAASVAAPTASAVSPNSASSGTHTLTITGNGFLHGANVKLTKAGQSDVPCGGQEIVSDGAKVRLTTTGMVPGQWNVVITNPDGQSTTLANAFTVVSGLFSEDVETGATGWTSNATSPYTTNSWATSTAKSRQREGDSSDGIGELCRKSKLHGQRARSVWRCAQRAACSYVERQRGRQHQCCRYLLALECGWAFHYYCYFRHPQRHR
ncbi:MAG: IPT/TIG domain-containing protein, partial [Prosthecobacter sp.]